jgi:Rrf2 family protein
MIKINKKIEYALIALKYMAERKEGNLTSAREICDQFNTPFDTTAKVLQQMNNKDILQSVKGIKGGYYLSLPLGQITYGQLSQTIEGKDSDNFCQSTKGRCDLYSTCNIIGPIEQLNRRINHFLLNLTLEDLLLKDAICLPLNTSNEIPYEEKMK